MAQFYSGKGAGPAAHLDLKRQARKQCNNVREKEGRGQGRLRRLVLYFKSKQSTSNTNLRSGTLNVPHAHNVSLRAFSHWSERTSSPPRFLSPSRSSDTLFYLVSPRSSLQSDTGVITLHLTHLLTARLPSLPLPIPLNRAPHATVSIKAVFVSTVLLCVQRYREKRYF